MNYLIRISTILLLASILFVSNVYAQSDDCNVYELLPEIPEGALSQDSSPSPCGFYQAQSGVYVNQCSPCGRKIMDDNCIDAPTPTLCELDGFVTTTGGFTEDLALDANGDAFALGFCNGAGTIENNFWIGFTAQTDEVCIRANVGDCTTNEGIQVAIVSTDCATFFETQQGPNPCTFSGISANSSRVFEADGLIPGDPYFIMVDGFAGDICELSFDVLCGFGEPSYDISFVTEALLCPDVVNPGSFASVVGSGTTVTVNTGGIATTDLTFYWLDPNDNIIAITSPTMINGTQVIGQLGGEFFGETGTYTVEIIDNGSCCHLCTSIPIVIDTPFATTAAVVGESTEPSGFNLVSLLGNPDNGPTPEFEQWQIINPLGDRETVVSSVVTSDGRVNNLEVTQDILTQFLSGQESGTATFIYGFKVKLDQICFSEAIIEVPFTLSTTAIQDVEIKDVIVYPNPSTGLINLSYDADLRMQQIAVYDIQGRKVYAQSYQDQSAFSVLDLSQLVQGVYFIEAQYEKGIFRDKVFILK